MVNNRIFITGLDSFTGMHLLSILESKGYEVFGTSRTISKPNIIKCDVTNKSELSKALEIVKPSYILHLAAISSPAHPKKIDFFLVNTLGTVNLLECILELNLEPTKVIITSSASVYGDINESVLDESLTCIPSNDYGISKYLMEELVSNYFSRINIIITRPFNYTGIGQSSNFLIPKIVNHFKDKKKQLKLGNIEVSREFNDVLFTCEAYVRLLFSEISGETVNIASGRGLFVKDIIALMSEISGHKIQVKIDKGLIRENEIWKLVGSPKKLFLSVGEIPQRGIRETLLSLYH